MLALRSPSEAYRRVDFDARVGAAGPGELVALCYEQLDLALGQAIRASARGDNARRSESLTRALSAITALQLGVDEASALAPALDRFYEAARRTVLGSVPGFDAAALTALRADFADVARGLAGV